MWDVVACVGFFPKEISLLKMMWGGCNFQYFLKYFFTKYIPLFYMAATTIDDSINWSADLFYVHPPNLFYLSRSGHKKYEQSDIIN